MLETSSITVLEEQTHISGDVVTVDEPAEEIFVPPPLTVDEETFVLAMVETGGNIASAFRLAYGNEIKFPLARGKALLANPGVVLKLHELTEKIQDASLISVGSHLNQLAEIRDLSITTGQLKTAYMAERSRGEAVGIYQRHEPKNSAKNAGNVAIQVNFVSKHDIDI